jgi:hypothetical protein
MNAGTLEELLRLELSNVPIEHWKDFFPAYTAIWRFIEQTWPGSLGPIRAGYDTEPYFEGRGSRWFTENLLQDERVIDAIESIMYSTVDSLACVIPGRDSLRLDEIPALNAGTVSTLARAVSERVDEALRTNALDDE